MTAGVPVVVVTLPSGEQIRVAHQPWDVEVDYRENPRHGWSPIHFWGGSASVEQNRPSLLPCEQDTGRLSEVRNDAKVIVLAERGTA